MIHEESSGKIIGAAMGVLNHLKPGLDEKLYEHAFTGLELALLPNFRSARLEWKRVVRQQERESEAPDQSATSA
jgi:hypothetical protein